MKFFQLFPLLLTLAYLPSPSRAEHPTEYVETADPQVMMSAGFAGMHFSDSEKRQFGKIIQTFTADVQQQIIRETRRNQPYLPHRIDWRLRYLFTDLDERVQPLINADRLASYHLFKAGLVRQMAPSSADNTLQIESFKRETIGQTQHH